MKIKMNPLFIAALALITSGFVFCPVSAKEGSEVKVEKAAGVQGDVGGNRSIQQSKIEDNSVATTSIKNDSKGDSKKGKKVEFGGEQHRSVISTFVQSLLNVADSEGGIGQEVRVIAQQQNETKDRAANIINAVEGRSKIKTFFIGTSYKNLGELRSQMVQTRNQIDQLKRLVDKADNDQDKAELQAQIQALETQQTSINDFIIKNESKFSLFGWAVKILRK